MPAESVPRALIDAALARQLITAQFPHWAHLPIEAVEPGGSDHVIFRLGASMSVRLPRGFQAARQAKKEHKWLPQIAPHLPLPIPEPQGLGAPAFGYPWHWSVSRWLDGETATADRVSDLGRAGAELAAFMLALQQLPLPGLHHAGADEDLTSETLHSRDESTRAAIDSARGSFDAAAMTSLWDAAMLAPTRGSPPVWFHGDLHPGNLLAADGRLSAVIDFERLGVGDPACDLVIAWTFLTAETRPQFRVALGCDDATWLRGMGWALTTGLNAYTSYASTNPRVATASRHQITEALAGYTRFGG